MSRGSAPAPTRAWPKLSAAGSGSQRDASAIVGSSMSRLPVVWDMETSDPDDFLTLLLLLDHPAVELKAVTITPGSTHQVGLVRRALEWFGRKDLPVGATNLAHPKQCVSPWHYTAYGQAPESTDAQPAGELLASVFDRDTTFI